MERIRRRYDLTIWALALGYFVLYMPYSALTRIISSGLLPGASRLVSGFEILPSAAIATAVVLVSIATAKGWWKYAGTRKFLGHEIPFPSGPVWLSGIGTAIIIGTTTLAFTFKGVSILLTLVLLRGGVLIMAPVIDIIFGRKVRWFSWTALALSFAAAWVALADVKSYQMTTIAAVNVAAYLTGYALRIPTMTSLAKSDSKAITYRYFVEELMVALPALIVMLGVLAAIGKGDLVYLRHGFTTFFTTGMVGLSLLVGAFYGCLYVFGTLIYLDRRENTFCVPLNRSSSMLSGVGATFGLTLLLGQPVPSFSQLFAAGLIVIAVLMLSPLHHSFEHWRELNPLLSRVRSLLPQAEPATGPQNADRVFLFVCSGNTCRSPMAEAIGNAEIDARSKLSPHMSRSSNARAMSAGVSPSANAGAPMPKRAGQALQAIGVPVGGHVSRRLTIEMVQQAEMIYCMQQSHRSAVLEMAPSATAKTHRLDPDADIEDPVEGSLEDYVGCARRIQDLVRRRLDEAGITVALA